ncbi:MAG: 2-dehydro-3-deoxygalactonokinase [Burkholderiaceae bacterium]|nr:2-dehydro-3-deoxygalactonokinase [Burkholderiaceae bacterium]
MPATPTHAAAAPRDDSASLIGVDWGSSALRAWLIDAGGIVARRESTAGVATIADGRFREALEALCGDWFARAPALPVIACGMIGSRDGWRDAGRVRTPAGLLTLAQRLSNFDDLLGRPFRVVPGLVARGQIDSPDLMRGGETQVFGALQGREGLFVLPGTHCRWVEVRDRQVVAFRTYMTGELYSLLCRRSTLASLCGDPDDSPQHQAQALRAFDEGVDHAGARPGSLTHLLFTARTEALLGGLDAHQLPAYLSGLLIGAEIRDASDWSPHDLVPTVVARSELASRYARAMHRLGLRGKVADGDSAAAGLAAIARAATLVA